MVITTHIQAMLEKALEFARKAPDMNDPTTLLDGAHTLAQHAAAELKQELFQWQHQHLDLP